MNKEPVISTKMLYDTHASVIYNRPREMALSFCDIGLEDVEIIITCHQSIEKTEALVKHLKKALKLDLVRFEMDYVEKKKLPTFKPVQCMCDLEYKCLLCRGLTGESFIK